MKRENLLLLINFSIMALIGLVFILIYQSNVMIDVEDQLFNQKVELVDGTKLATLPQMSENSSNFSMVDMKWNAVDKNDEKVGTVYHAVIKNSFTLSGSGLDYGLIELLIGFSEDDKVYVEYIGVYQSQWAIVGIQKYIQDYYNGVDILSIQGIPSFDADIVAGATENPANVSTDQIKEIVMKALILEYPELEEVNPYEELFGIENYQFEDDATFVVTEHVTDKRIVTDGTNQIGYVYSLTGSGEYQGGDDASIVIEIVFGSDDTILGFVLPEETYNHSGGSFKSKNEEYLENYIGLLISEIQAEVDAGNSTDVTSGASNTRALIDELLEAFVSEVN
ncbi:hypothetical protein BK011_00875 [Tenericutes bacterium MZ-XQ]|jgi:hypothetical protein|nr:hypothetical protein BK011_00875 [Tenericutes bacterium MZ-XQ]